MATAIAVQIGQTNVTFHSPEQMLSYVRAHGYTVEPTRYGIRVIDRNNQTIFEY